MDGEGRIEQEASDREGTPKGAGGRLVMALRWREQTCRKRRESDGQEDVEVDGRRAPFFPSFLASA